MLMHRQGARRPLGLFEPRRRPASFEDMVTRCMQDAERVMRSPRSYRSHARRFLEWWGGRDLAAVGVREVEEYVRVRLGEARPGTVRHELAFLSRAFMMAIREGRAFVNPVTLAGRPVVKEGRTRVLSEEEEERVRGEMGAGDWAVVRFALLTGMRRGELFGLRPVDVCLYTRFARLEETKNGEGRNVPLNPEAVGIVEGWLGRLRRGARWLVEDRPRTKRENVAGWFVESRFRPALARAGVLGMTFHGLRHTFASRLVMKGVPLRTVQELLGHKSPMMTLRYSHLSPGHLLEAVGRL